jgi:hypothetical protein
MASMKRRRRLPAKAIRPGVPMARIVPVVDEAMYRCTERQRCDQSNKSKQNTGILSQQ